MLTRIIVILMMCGLCFGVSRGRYNPTTASAISRAIANGWYKDAGNSGATYTFDFSGGKNFQSLTLTADCTITLPTASVGTYILKLTQDVTGSRTPTFSDGIRWPGGVDPVWTSTASQSDIVTLVCDGTAYFASSVTTALAAYNALNQDLVAYWKFNESSGNAADSSGNDYTLTNTNTVTYAAGKLNNAASFASASTQYMILSTVPSSLWLDTIGDWTLCAWFYLDSVAADHNILTLGDVAGKVSVEFRYDDVVAGTDPVANDRFSCVVFSNGSSISVSSYSTTEIVAETWYFACSTYDASTDTIQTYLNAVKEKEVGSAAIYDHSSSTPVLNIGRSNFSGGSRYFNGDIDNLCVFNKVLSQSEINELYNAGFGTESF